MTTVTIEQAYDNLAKAIVVRAGVDYLKTKKKLETVKDDTKRNRLIGKLTELKRFFASRWFKELTTTNPEWYVEQLDEAFENMKRTKTLKLIDRIHMDYIKDEES